MCGGSFGSGGFGASAFGSGYALSIESAREVSLNRVDVTFSVAPMMGDGASIWDALNPANWTLVALEPGGVVRLAQYAERVSSVVVSVFFDGPLTAPSLYSIVANQRVRSSSGGSLAPTCRSASFATFPLVRIPPSISRPDVRSDIANPDGVGTFQPDEKGDLSRDSGRAYLRKRVTRRATAALGSFFHLPNYGFEVALGSLLRPSTFPAVAARAQGQILIEPDVQEASVRVSANPQNPGQVLMDIKVRDTLGNTDSFTVAVPFGS